MIKIEAKTIAERRVEWTPKGWDWKWRKIAIVKDGKIKGILLLNYHYFNQDIDGAIKFLQAIKRAMAETKK